MLKPEVDKSGTTEISDSVLCYDKLLGIKHIVSYYIVQLTLILFTAELSLQTLAMLMIAIVFLELKVSVIL